jgi:site-specific DNA recombinase
LPVRSQSMRGSVYAWLPVKNGPRGQKGLRANASCLRNQITGAEQIAAREQCSVRQVHMTMSLAFLAPKLVQAATEGRLPRGIGVSRLRDPPAEWSRQYAMLGLSI